MLLIPFLGCSGLVGFVFSTSPGLGPSEPAVHALVVSLVTLTVLAVLLFRAIRDLADLPDRLHRYVVRSISVLGIFDAGLIAITEPRIDGIAAWAVACCVLASITTSSRWTSNPSPSGPRSAADDRSKT